MANKYDKILGEYREEDTATKTFITEVSTDPTSPEDGETWVLYTHSVGSGGGKLQGIVGLSFPLLSAGAGGSSTYQLSYRTNGGTTKRVTLT